MSRRDETQARIARIKEQSLLTIIEGITGETLYLSSKVSCLLPDHDDRSPSFHIKPEFWKCFGCQAGGDAIAFARQFYGVGFMKAIRLIEQLLGLTSLEDQTEEVELLARAKRRKKKRMDPRLWDRTVDVVEDEFLRIVRPFLRCRDPLVFGLSESWSLYIFDELDASRRSPPSTDRGRRETLRDLRGFTVAHARGITREVLRVTGKDRLDCALQATPAKKFGRQTQ